MTRNYLDLGSASDWSYRVGNLIQPIRSTTQVWVVTRHQYGNFCARFSDLIWRGNQRKHLGNIILTEPEPKKAKLLCCIRKAKLFSLMLDGGSNNI